MGLLHFGQIDFVLSGTNPTPARYLLPTAKAKVSFSGCLFGRRVQDTKTEAGQYQAQAGINGLPSPSPCPAPTSDYLAPMESNLNRASSPSI
jgi:hypothetical protein